MAPFPLPLGDILGHWGAYAVFLVIGIAFGYVLEISGFGYSPKLAAQFYFKDFTVLKVMFGAIIVAMVGIFLATAAGLLDYNLIWVNPTYLWPGIVGGVIMGFGFIIGGFCPGTSLVAAATGKLDGIFFVLGVFFGIFMFGETVENFDEFWYSSDLGRFTLQDLFNVDAGVIVVGVVLMALFMFWGGEKLEKIFGGKDPAAAPKWRYAAAIAIFAVAVLVLLMGQPTTAERWDRLAAEKDPLLAERAYQIHPGELIELKHDTKISVILIDVRGEADYNLFHIQDAVHIPLDELDQHIAEFHFEPANTVFVTVSNDEAAATEAWKMLVAEAVPNVYILGDGINGWLTTFAEADFLSTYAAEVAGDDELAFVFDMAYGARHPVAEPVAENFVLEYEKKVELETKRAPTSGGCG